MSPKSAFEAERANLETGSPFLRSNVIVFQVFISAGDDFESWATLQFGTDSGGRFKGVVEILL